MAKKAIHHIRRSFSFLLGAVGVIVLLGIFAWGVLVWRLSQGPLNLDYLTAYLERAFNNDKTDFVFDVGTTVLTWYGRFEPFEIEMHDVRVTRPDNTPVLRVEKAGVRLSKRNLVLGRIVPREIRIYNPTLRVIRWEDGHLSLNLGHPPEQVYGPALPSSEAADEKGSLQLVRGLLEKLRAGSGVVGGLRQIDIRDAEIFYVDKNLNVRWRSRNADARIVSERGEEIVADLAMVFSAAKDNKAFLRGSVRYDWKTDKTRTNLSFSGINPARIAQESETLKDLSEIDMPIKGAFQMNLGSDLKPEDIRFSIGADPGTFNALGFYKTPVAVQNLYIFGSADMKAKTMSVSQAKIDFGGVIAEAAIDLATGENGIRDVNLKAVLTNTPMDDLHKYWPETLATDARGWVTQNLSKGMATKATLETEISYDAAAEEGKKVALKKVGGEIDFTGIQVDYFSPLMPATEAHGKATYDHKSFNLDIAGGKLGDMVVTKSVIHITDLDIQSETVDSKIDVSVSLKGPLRTALKVLDSPPLEYPKMLGINSGEVEGKAAIDVNFKFPLRKDLEVENVHVTASAEVDDVLLKGVVAGLDLAGGPMKVTLGSDSVLGVKGSGRLAGMPLTFDWEKHFAEGAAIDSRVSAKGAANSAVLAAFGVPPDLNIVGNVPADVAYTHKADGSATLALKADLSPVSFTVPVVDYKKAVGSKGSLDMQMSLKNDRPEAIRGLNLKTDDASVKGDVEFTIDAATGTFAVKKAVLNQVVLGNTDITVTGVNKGVTGYDLTIRGKQFDASSFFSAKSAENSDIEAAIKVTPLKADIDIGRMVTGEGKSLEKPRIRLERNEWQRIDRLEIDALAGGKPFTVRYGPQGKGRSLDVKADHAGAALSILGLANSVRGGRLSVEAATGAKDGPRDLRGTIVLADFTLKDAPVIAKLLNAMSLPGILQLLSGQGLSFKKAKANFAWMDKGQPEQKENVRYITISDGQTSGASLGLTFEGSIDNWKNTYDLEGTIIPASEVNKLVGIIPIVGDILTGGGEGVIAAKYTIKGPKDNPRVMVNPLSVLAPGILRKIFFD